MSTCLHEHAASRFLSVSNRANCAMYLFQRHLDEHKKDIGMVLTQCPEGGAVRAIPLFQYEPCGKL